MYSIDQRWQDEVKRFDSNLYLAFDSSANLFEIRHKIPFTNIDRRVMFIHKQGEFRRMDYDVIDELRHYDWMNIYKYKTSDDLSAYYLEKMEYNKKLIQKKREEERKFSVRDNIKSFERLQERMKATMKPEEVAVLKKNQDKLDLERSKRPNFY